MLEYLKLIVDPVVWIIFFLVCGLIMTHKDVRRSFWLLIGWNFCLLSALIMILLSTDPVESLLVSTLESRYIPVSNVDLDRMDVIVILAGGLNSKGSFKKSPEASGDTYSRLFNGVEAFKKSSAKKIILSGGKSKCEPISEAEVMRDLSVKLGVLPNNIILEDRSRNTASQAREIRKMNAIYNNTVVGLVTSAMHMMRAVTLFKKEFPKVEIIPIPVGFTYSTHAFSFKDIIPSEDCFHQSSLAIHELLGWLSNK